MKGDDHARLCASCNCHVHNIAEMSADEAEELLANNEHVCTRVTSCNIRGILTRDGWIPRMLAAGAIAATVSGCEMISQTSGVRISKRSYLRMAQSAQEQYRADCEKGSGATAEDLKEDKRQIEKYRRAFLDYEDK